MPNDSAKQLINDFAGLREARSNWDSTWQRISDYVFPFRDFTTERSSGLERTQHIFDTTGPQALDELSSGIFGLTINPGIRWFNLVLVDQDANANDQNRIWLDDCVDRMLAVINSPETNFYVQGHETILELLGYGTSCMFTRDNVRSFVASSRSLNECYIKENNNGIVDTVFRSFKLTARQCLQEFGDTASDEMQRMAKDKPEHKFPMLHAVFPRTDRNIELMNNKNMPWASVYIDVERMVTLREGGFKEFPYMVPRWMKASKEEYGRSPAMKMLPSIRTVNAMQRVILRGAQLAIAPPLVMDDDSAMSKVRFTPFAINHVRKGSRLEPLNVGARPDIGYKLIEMEREQIRRGFHLHLFQIPESDRMTAMEVAKRTQTQMQELSDKANRFHKEFARAFVIRLFNVMFRNNGFLKPPASISGQAFEIDFISPLAVSQKASDVTAFQQWLAMIAPLAQSGMPVLDNLDSDVASRSLARILSVPQKFLADRGVVERIRAQRQDLQMKQMQAQQAVTETTAAKNAAQAQQIAGMNV